MSSNDIKALMPVILGIAAYAAFVAMAYYGG